jgi:hypothetical protein
VLQIMLARTLSDIAQESIAGLIWLHLDLPDDASRQEVEAFAAVLIGPISRGLTPESLEDKIRWLQSQRFCRISSPERIRILARRCIALMRSETGSISAAA